MPDMNLPPPVGRRRPKRPLISTLTFVLALPILFAFFLVAGLWRQTERHWRRTGTARSPGAACLIAQSSLRLFSL
jgi:hypothetical protein